jgi:multiple sugar transport system permease protein
MPSRRGIAFFYGLPWSLTLLVFWAFPIGYSFLVGFTDYQLLQDGFHWVGLANYSSLLHDRTFISSLINTFVFVGGTIPATTIISLLLALLLNAQFKGQGFFRSAYFIPSITSLVVVSLIFTNLYSRGGYIGMLAGMVGIPSPENGFLYDNRTALWAIMGMDVWMSVGYYMLIFLAGLKAIPDELYEAAEINGASHFRQFWSITLPLLKPVTLFVVVVNSIKSFQVFTEIFVMTGGKFNTSTTVYEIYQRGLTTQFEFGTASAAAYILFVVIGVFSLIQFALLRRKGSYTW